MTLGQPIPAGDVHAVSVSLPTWQSNVDYEEGRIQLDYGYPRFVIGSIMRELLVKLGVDFVYPTQAAMDRCIEFVTTKHSGFQYASVQGKHVWGIKTNGDGLKWCRLYWQHCGEIVSTRRAQAELAGQEVYQTDSHKIVKERLGRLYNMPDVYLFPSGMNAIWMAYRMVTTIQNCNNTVQYGFPYIDTLKLQQVAGTCIPLLGNDKSYDSKSVAAVFTELPSNPLLEEPDLQVVKQEGIPLVVDDTLSGPINNKNCIQEADVIVSSLTKLFSGTGNVMAGCLILNPKSPFYGQFKEWIDSEYEEHALWYEDAVVLESNSRDYVDRNEMCTANTLKLAKYLENHPQVQKVFYSKSGSCVLSFVLKQPELTTSRFYDLLPVCKGPSLGTNFTLCCPYTLIAHYHELDKVEQQTDGKVSRWLLRISVGCQPEDAYLCDVFQRVFEQLR